MRMTEPALPKYWLWELVHWLLRGGLVHGVDGFILVRFISRGGLGSLFVFGSLESMKSSRRLFAVIVFLGTLCFRCSRMHLDIIRYIEFK